MQDGEPPVLSEEYVPAGHITQAFDEVEPVAELKYPEGHLEHEAAPAREYVPAAHVTHVEADVDPSTGE